MTTPIHYKGQIQLGVWKYLEDVNSPPVFGCVSSTSGVVALNGGFPVISGATDVCSPCSPDSFSLSTVGNGSWSWDKSVALTFRVNGGSPIVIHHTFTGAGGAVRDLLAAISAAAGLSSSPALIKVATADGLFLATDSSDTDMVLDVHGIAIGVSIFHSMPTTLTIEPTDHSALGVGEEDMAVWWGITAPETYHTCGYSIAV